MATTTITSTDKHVSSIEVVEIPDRKMAAHKSFYEPCTLWTGPSVIATVRTGKTAPTQSILKLSSREPSAIRKYHRVGPVHLGRLGFEGDQQTYHEHGGPEKSILQYNPDHYLRWRDELKDVMMKDEKKRNALLDMGGFGENLATHGPISGPVMDESTVCVGDIIGIRKVGNKNTLVAKIKVTGPRQPCFKLNHRFGIANMSQRSQNKFRTGWMYATYQEGDVEIGDEMVLLERPYPEWSCARIQHYLYNEPKNNTMIKQILETLKGDLVFDVREVFENRLKKGVENMNLRLKDSDSPDQVRETFVEYKLCQKRKETSRITEFVFERVVKVDECSSAFTIATPGSHVRLKLKLPERDNLEVIRPYSIVAGNTNSFRLGVALADKSRGGSSYLHQHLQVSGTVEASETFANTFPLVSEGDADKYVFLAGGIGITAFLDHIQHCVDYAKSFHLHYMIRKSSDAAFLSEIQAIVNKSQRNGGSHDDAYEKQLSNIIQNFSITKHSQFQVSVYDSASGNRCNVKTLLASIANENRTHVYVCGSERLSDSVTVHAHELNLPDSRLHFEQFSVDASGDPFVAELTESKKKIQVGGVQSLLDALREAGLDVASSCEAGNCGTCRVRVRCGKILHKGTGLPDDEKAGGGYEGEAGDMLSCVSRGIGTIQIEL